MMVEGYGIIAKV